MSANDQIHELRKEVEDLKKQLDELKMRNQNLIETESLIAFGFTPISLRVLKKLFFKFLIPKSIYKRMDVGTLQNNLKGVHNLGLELLKNLPAINIMRLSKRGVIKFEIDKAINFKRIPIKKIVEKQGSLIETMLIEQDKTLRNEIRKSKYQIGRIKFNSKNFN